MGEIYQHAALNLAAGAAINSHSSLMSTRRNTSLVRPFRTQIDWSSVPSEMKILNAQPYFILDKDFLSENFQKTLLNRRAWILQEQTLSPRTLHFGKHQLFWKCRNTQSCETFPFGIPDLPVDTVENYLSPSKRQVFRVEDAYKWLQVVERYSSCGITRLSDKFIAITGLQGCFTRES